MGTQHKEKPMGDTEVLIQQSLKYEDLIYEYFTLASKTRLTQKQSECLDEILQKAQFDPWLDFLIDEADHILGHELNLINDEFIEHQQNKLKKSLDRQWCEQFLQQIQAIHKQNHLKELQKYLQYKGLYDGVIDDELGSFTQIAMELIKNECQTDSEKANCFDPKTRSVC